MANKSKQQQNLSQNPPAPSRLEELNNLSDSELAERYLNTFQVEVPEGMPRESVIAAINDAAPKAPAPEVKLDDVVEEGGKVYGNKDKAKKYPIQKDWKDKVVVRQAQIQEINGGKVEVPNTEAIQTYDPAYFDKLIKDKFFSESKMDVQILHQPR